MAIYSTATNYITTGNTSVCTVHNGTDLSEDYVYGTSTSSTYPTFVSGGTSSATNLFTETSYIAGDLGISYVSRPSTYIIPGQYVTGISENIYEPFFSDEATKKYQIQAMIRSNLTIQVKSRNNPTKYPDVNEPERKALETLREMITEEEFRKYVMHGFILVRGLSGAVYQIFRDRAHCKVWLRGKMIEEVCVRIENKNIPKTDKVIALKTIIETSEEEFKKLGNVYKMAA